MSVEQTHQGYMAEESKVRRMAFPRSRIRRTIGIGVAMALALILAGGGAIPASEARARSYAMTVAGWGFNLLTWEVDALAEKISASFTKPADEYPPRLASIVVLEYMERAKEIGLIEENLTGCISRARAAAQRRSGPLVRSSELRAEQHNARVEQVIQRQVGSVLELAGLTVGRPFPPILYLHRTAEETRQPQGADCNRLQPHARAERPGPHPEAEAQINGTDNSRATSQISADWKLDNGCGSRQPVVGVEHGGA